jgi:hypothetical protein
MNDREKTSNFPNDLHNFSRIIPKIPGNPLKRQISPFFPGFLFFCKFFLKKTRFSLDNRFLFMYYILYCNNNAGFKG